MLDRELTEAEKSARSLISKLPTEQLLDQWELTTEMAMTEPGAPGLRGWIMDELEKRNPEGFDKWLDDDECNDEDLRKFILG